MPVGFGPSNVSTHAASGMGIEVTMDPSPLILIAQFDKLGLDIRSYKVPLTRSIQQVVAPSLVRNFYAQGRPDQWPELTDQTVDRKYSEGYGNTAPFPLVRTGALRQVAGQLNIWNIDGLEGVATIELPEKVWYGRVHQEGSNEGTNARYLRKGMNVDVGSPGRVPQRIWAVIQDEDLPAIEKVFDVWLRERFLMAGFR